MSFLEDIFNILDTEQIGTRGENLFAAELPNKPDSCICLYEYAGKIPTHFANHRHPGLQIVVRNPNYLLGRAKIELIYGLLSTIEQIETQTKHYLKFAPVQEPTPLGKDAFNRHLFVQNFIVTYFEEE